MYATLKRSLARRPALVLALILLISLIPRATMLTGVGHAGDFNFLYVWATCTEKYGVTGLYHCPAAVNHPPIDPVTQGIAFLLYRAAGGSRVDLTGVPDAPPDDDPVAFQTFMDQDADRALDIYRNYPALVAVLKLPSLLFELALIGLAFTIAYQKAGLQWAVLAALLLSFNPGLMAVTAWWGQTDSIFTFFLLLSAYLFTKDRPGWAWAAYALAWLAKFQAVIVLPLVLVLCLRRFGLRKTITGLMIFAGVFGVVMLPFLLSAQQAALLPYQSVDRYPFTSVNAYNLWIWVQGRSWLPDDVGSSAD